MSPDEILLVEPVPAPEIFVDGYQSTMIANGVVKFTFFSMGHNVITGQHERRIVMRMSAPLQAVVGIHEALGGFLEQVAQMGGGLPGEQMEGEHGRH